ncbi:hypothetical protein H257_15551, partial [Aphanomyces astaci]
MEATLRRAVNEIFFRDTWSWPTVATFLATVVGTFYMSNALSRMAFSFIFDGPSQQRRTAPIAVPAHDIDDSDESSHDDESNDDSDSASSSTSSSDEDETCPPTGAFVPIKMRIPSMLDIDPAVAMVREVDHLKSL